MDPSGVSEREFQSEVQELLAAARSMAEGNFFRLVNVKARGAIGDLAAYINTTIQNLQHLDPAVKGSRHEIPKVAQELAEVIQTTEDATNRVLEEAEHLVEEGAKIETGLSRAAEALRRAPTPQAFQEGLKGLEELREVQRRAQGRAMDIMSAMEFQDLTTQKIQKLIALVAEVEERLLRILVLFRLEEAAGEGRPSDRIVQSCAESEAALCNQDLVDQLLQDFRRAGA